jgi:hypothetical protein
MRFPHQLALAAIASLALAGRTLGAQTSADSMHTMQHVHGSKEDSAFHDMQNRGKHAMGVDQYTSPHQFLDLADGGRIELQRDRDDSAGVAAIRDHMRTIARAFAAGDFSIPGYVHQQTVPGTQTMAAKRSVIHYEMIELPRGGAVRITTSDRTAIDAIHRFLAFQRAEHRTNDVK